jgi:hypothetical protein
MSSDFLCDLITFEHMLEGLDLKAEIIRHMQQHEDFILPVAVRVHQTLTFKHFDERASFRSRAGGIATCPAFTLALYSSHLNL